MCLQTYLYYYCQTLLYALENRHITPLVHYGMCCVSSLCDCWINFFMPSFLASWCKNGEIISEEAWEHVTGIYKAVQVLKERCNAASDAIKSNDAFAVRCEFKMLESLLTHVVIPTFDAVGYASDDTARAVYFAPSGMFLSSFSPVSGTQCPDCIPGIYTAQEEQVVQAYMRLVKNAPSIDHLLRLSENKDNNYSLVSYFGLQNRTDMAAGLVQFDYHNSTPVELCETILRQWPQGPLGKSSST